MSRPALAFVVAALCVSGVAWFHRAEILSWDRFRLPAFDSYVYVAMTEEPRVFTIAPWGYRILTPWLAQALPWPAVRAHRFLSPLLLSLSGAVLFAFWRRLGHRTPVALVGVALFALSPPVAQLLRSPLLSDPAAVLLTSLFVFALEAGASVAVLALVLAVGAYAKETFLLFPPAIYLLRRGALGHRRAALQAVGAGVPAWAAFALLRLWWTPHLDNDRPAFDLDLLRTAAATFVERWPATWPGLLVGGIVPFALAGAFLPEGRRVLRRHGYLLAVTLVLPFVAWINIPGTEPVILFGVNVHRLLVYALPFLVPLALAPVARAAGGLGPAPPAWSPGRRARAVAAAATALVVLAPLALLDRYRRAPFPALRDGPLVLAQARESLRAARALAAGETVEWRLDEGGYVPGENDPRHLGGMRWYLREGWGDLPHYGHGPAVLRAPSGSLLVPTLGRRDLALDLDLGGAGARVSLNGRPAGVCRAETPSCRVVLPASVLVRGDNVVGLEAQTGLTLTAIRVTPR
jgi:hypothetical protein